LGSGVGESNRTSLGSVDKKQCTYSPRTRMANRYSPILPLLLLCPDHPAPRGRDFALPPTAARGGGGDGEWILVGVVRGYDGGGGRVQDTVESRDTEAAGEKAGLNSASCFLLPVLCFLFSASYFLLPTTYFLMHLQVFHNGFYIHRTLSSIHKNKSPHTIKTHSSKL